LNGKTLALSALATTLLLSGCVSDTRVAAGPVRTTTVVAAPPPRPVVVAEPVYVPEPHDAYISVALDSDIVYTGGNTYIWYVGQDGRRHRHYYGRGDLRGDVMHRRANLRIVMAHHEGHLPMQKVHMAPRPARHAAPGRSAHFPQQREAHRPPQAHEAHRGHPAPQAHQSQHGKPGQTPNRTAETNHQGQPRT
jgi:hypothetical protein